jgi:hypothetical protein
MPVEAGSTSGRADVEIEHGGVFPRHHDRLEGEFGTTSASTGTPGGERTAPRQNPRWSRAGPLPTLAAILTATAGAGNDAKHQD